MSDVNSTSAQRSARDNAAAGAPDTSPPTVGGLAINGLAVRFGHVAALRGVDLTVADGEIVTIIGANGAGKSTLLNAVAGAVSPSAGTVSWRGQSLGGLPPRRVLAAGVGYVPEGRAVFGALSVLDNLLLGAYGRRSAGGTAWWRLIAPRGAFAREPGVAAGLERVFGLFPRLAERRTQLAGSLSGGEQQMLAIGRALMAEPRLLLLDEPSVGLAPMVVRELLGLLPRLRADGLTILLVEQDAVCGAARGRPRLRARARRRRAGRPLSRPARQRSRSQSLPRRLIGSGPNPPAPLPARGEGGRR